MRLKILLVLIVIVLIPITAAQTSTEEKLQDLASEAESNIAELSEMGISITFFNDTLKDAKDALEVKNYALAQKKLEEIEERKETALSISDSLRVLSLRIDELGGLDLDIQEARELFSLAKNAFNNELYEDANVLISRTAQKLDDVEAEATALSIAIQAARDNIVFYARDNWELITVSLAAIFIVAFVFYKQIKMSGLKRKRFEMQLEYKVLKKLVKNEQIKYAQKRTISKNEYDMASKNYRSRMLQIERELPVIRDNIKKSWALFPGTREGPKKKRKSKHAPKHRTKRAPKRRHKKSRKK